MEQRIEYHDDPSTLTVGQLQGGFFEGWPSPPSADVLLRHLRAAEVAITAVDTTSGMVIGFASAVGDGILVAFVPLLEVLPAYRRRGIGTQLMRRVLQHLESRYSIDLVCDEDLVPFYARLGGVPMIAIAWRNVEALPR